MDIGIRWETGHPVTNHLFYLIAKNCHLVSRYCVIT
jgi:hypothetical protein